MKHKLPAMIASLGALFLSALAVFVWNEARKEIFFLCGNFMAGMSEESVVRQLDTGNFLRSRREAGASGSRIIADSRYNLGAYSCYIELDREGVVAQAYVE